jgi:hypothetical protein
MIFEVEIPKKIKTEYLEFAKQCVDTNKNLYKNRAQRNTDKITEDIYNGKLGEYGAYCFLEAQKLKPDSLPDTKIYSRKDKTFAADLFCDGVPVHVKTQSHDSASRYGTSWTFQFDGEGGRKSNHFDPIIKNPNGVVIFVVVEDSYKSEGKTKAYIYAAVPAGKCIPSLLELPKLDYLKKYKRVIYYETLKKKIKNLCNVEELRKK